jgi:GT2 family glycosyltransferase
MQNNNSLVSVITVNYNSLEATCALLKSLHNSRYEMLEVIVVDNGSNEDPTEAVKQIYPAARVIISEKNLGFSGGNNLGIRASQGDFLLLINNDTEITPDLIGQLLNTFSKDPKIGIVCPKIKFFYQPDTIQYAGFNKFNLFTGRTSTIGGGQKDCETFSQPDYTHGAHGAAMMISRSALKQVGLLPESYFLYYEEWDWSFTMMRCGYKIYYQGQAVIYHKQSVSTGKESILKTYYLSRNRILFMKRNTTAFQYVIFLFFLFLCVIPKFAVQYSLKMRFETLLYFMKGIINGTFMISGKEDPAIC